jgi:hypothetical protein
MPQTGKEKTNLGTKLHKKTPYARKTEQKKGLLFTKGKEEDVEREGSGAAQFTSNLASLTNTLFGLLMK